MVIFFLVTLTSCISLWLISSFLFAFRFPVIRFENFCWESSNGDFGHSNSCPLQILCLFENIDCGVNETKSLFMFLNFRQRHNLFFSLETVQLKVCCL